MNAYQAATSPAKLRGQFYTPAGLVDLVFRSLHLTPEHRILDPACGDGSFLRGALHEARRRFPKVPPEHWLERIGGFDVDAAAAADAVANLQATARALWGRSVPVEQVRVRPGDALRARSRSALLRRAGLTTGGPLLIAGNPPYVEAKRLDAAAKRDLAARFPGAVVGAPDLYLYFLHAALGWLQPGDRLAFVLPNKLLVSSNAATVRGLLLDRGLLRGLWFATQTDAFNGAGVYPIVMFVGGGPGAVRTSRLRRRGDRFEEYDSADILPDLFGHTESRALFLPPEDAAGRAALERLLTSGAPRLGEVLDIRWTVSFHRAGLRERFVFPARPRGPHAQPFFGGAAFSGNGEVGRYRCEWAGSWIDYDEQRLRAERNCVPPLELFRRPRVVICQNGRTLRAAYDESGAVLKDTFLCGLPTGDHPAARFPRAAVGLLCSRAAHFFYSHVFFGGHVNGGYLHFLHSFLREVPVGHWTEAAAEETAELVRLREAAGGQVAVELEERIEARVTEALDLSPGEVTAVEEWTRADANWTARERTRKRRSA